MEIEIIKFLQANSNSIFDFIFIFISNLATFFSFLCISIIIFLFVDKIFAYFFSGTYVVGVSINYVLKTVINRPRPFEVDSTIKNLLPTISKSMPSGHMLSFAIITAFIIFLVFTRSNNNIFKILSCILAFLLNFLVFISRMYLGQHFISDCIVGFTLGVVIALLGLIAYSKRRNIYEYFRNLKQKS